MAALLQLRRRAAIAAMASRAMPKPQPHATTTNHDASRIGGGREGGGGGERGKNSWVELPPFAPFDATSAARAISRGRGSCTRSSNATAIRWVRRCCPQLPAPLLHKLFRLRKVKKNLMITETCLEDANAEQLQFRRVSAKDELAPGDILFLPVVNLQESVAEKTKKADNKNEIDFLRSLEIYKDNAIVVINKPPGMPVQGGVGIKYSIDILAPMFLEENSSESPRLVHRLDRDCSGVLVLGRNQCSASILHAIFREKTADALADGTQQVLQRKYVALVLGRPNHPKGLLSAPLAKVILQDGKSERLTVRAGVNTAPVQDALTEYRVIESCPQGYSWLELFPLTGRKHQLRVHCAEVLGTPIVGDYKYGEQAHQNWMPLSLPQTIDKGMLKRQKLPFGLVLGGRSIAEQQPQLHLHCKQMILPDISAAVKLLQSSDVDHDLSELEKLNFVARLPLHMRLSWEILKSEQKQ